MLQVLIPVLLKGLCFTTPYYGIQIFHLANSGPDPVGKR